MKPKFFRDPIHMQIRFAPVDISSEPKGLAGEEAVSWVVRRLVDTRSFQRLRLIRQNGLANYVFHGMEHSRFGHSMGVSHLAREMHARIVRNMGYQADDATLIEIATASLVHDVGHGPFSHTFEEVLGDLGVKFKHETMTLRYIEEGGSGIHNTLSELSADLPDRISPFFDKEKRTYDHWKYKIVSSQMDADRLDYAHRDAKFAGITGHGYDIERILDLISIHGDCCIAVDRGAIEAVEAYLLTLDQLYRAIYYHTAVRAASNMFSAALRRALDLRQKGDETTFPTTNGRQHPVLALVENGDQVDLETYSSLSDATMWSLIQEWAVHKDRVLSYLADGLLSRRLLKSIEKRPEGRAKQEAAIAEAKDLTRKLLGDMEDAENYLVIWDDPSRVSYKGYDWGNEAGDESIWVTGEGKKDVPVEAFGESHIISALRQSIHFDRLIVAPEVRDALIKS